MRTIISDDGDRFEFLYVTALDKSTLDIQIINAGTYSDIESALQLGRVYLYSSYIPSVFKTCQYEIETFKVKKETYENTEYVVLPRGGTFVGNIFATDFCTV